MQSIVVFIVLLAASLVAGCQTHFQLDPSFAPRSTELPMNEVRGVFPPKDFVVGPYRVIDVSYARDDGSTLSVGRVDSKSPGSWHLGASFDGPDLKGGIIDCSGRVEPAQTRQRRLHVTLGGDAPLGCKVYDGKHEWALLNDFELSPGEAAPAWARGLRDARDGSSDRTNGATVSVLLDNDGRVIFVDDALQPSGIRAGNIRGFNFRVGEDVFAVLDVSATGAPHAFMARDVPADLRPSLVAAVAAIYLLTGLNP